MLFRRRLEDFHLSYDDALDRAAPGVGALAMTAGSRPEAPAPRRLIMTARSPAEATTSLRLIMIVGPRPKWPPHYG